MKIEFIKPHVLCVAEDGSVTENFGVGEHLESNNEFMIGGMKLAIKTGHAIEIGGNVAAKETKDAAPKPKRKPRVKKAAPTETK